jgi:hypothetical protein
LLLCATPVQAKALPMIAWRSERCARQPNRSAARPRSAATSRTEPALTFCAATGLRIGVHGDGDRLGVSVSCVGQDAAKIAGLQRGEMPV